MENKHMTARRFGRYAIVSLGGVAVLWLGGLILFAAHIKAQDIPVIDASLEPTDAIVVLTGGSERVNAGLELLKTGKAKKLFISGVHPGLKLDQLLGMQPVTKAMREGRVMLGHDAASTMGNAEETLAWMKLEDYHSLRLVTGNYHMPRSLMIFRVAMPDIKIIPHPVVPDHVLLEHWWQHAGTANLLVTEYDKYLWANLRLMVGVV